MLERTGSDGLRMLSFPSGKAASSGHNSHESSIRRTNSHESSIRRTNSRGSSYEGDGPKHSSENEEHAQLLKNGVPLKVFSLVCVRSTLDAHNTLSRFRFSQTPS